MKLKYFKAGAVSASVLVLGLAGVTLASADPTTANRPYAAVGSDTTQDVWSGLTNGPTAGLNNGPLRSIASWDAFHASGDMITLNTSGNTISRPNGSGAGVKALSASLNPANHVYKDSQARSYTLAPGDVDIARSSSAPSKAGTELIFLPFARDAMTFAYRDSQGRALNLTPDQIKNIFTCTAGSGVEINADGKPVVDGFVLTPKIPNSSSGTYSFFMKAAGLTTVNTTCVPASNSGFPENDATFLANDGDIVAFSAAQWIAQQNGAMRNTTSAEHRVADINGLKAIDAASSVPALRQGPLFGSPSAVPAVGFGNYTRDVYNVVGSDVQTSTETRKVIVRNSITTLLKTTASKAIISKYGFMNIDYVGDWTQGKPSGYTN